ncbi:MAG: urease accessory UreF family protein [Pseudomonadota bacterium]
MTLATWLSPSYPIGAFSWSHGLETLVAQNAIHDPVSLECWIADVLANGAGRTDAVLLARAYRAAADPAALTDIAALARALAPSLERLRETAAQGAAFERVTMAAWGSDLPVAPVAPMAPAAPAAPGAGDATEASDPVLGVGPDPEGAALPYPVALGRAAGQAGIALDLVLAMALQAMAANLISAGIRLIPIGQTDGQRVLASLHPLCRQVAAAAAADGAALGGCAILTDIAAMQHETLRVRLFQS